MNPQNISYDYNQSPPRSKKLLRIAVIILGGVAAILIVVFVASLFVKPASPEKLTQADTVAFAALATPSGFTKSNSHGITALNGTKDICNVLYGIVPTDSFIGSDIKSVVTEMTTQMRSQGMDVSDGIDVQSLSIPSSKGDKSYAIPTQQITFSDGSATSTANYSIQKLKSKKLLSVSQVCTTVDGSDSAAKLSSLKTITKLLQLDVTVQKTKN